MRVARRPAVWTRRGVLAAVLLAAAVIPGKASSSLSSAHCAGARCRAAGSILWTRALPGSWIAENGVTGTVPATGEAYVAASGGLAVVGYGNSVYAYQVRTGQPVWQATLSQLPPGAVIVSARAWPGAVALGVAGPASHTGQNANQTSLGPLSWSTVILSAATGAVVRTYPAAESGGAVWAGPKGAVVVGSAAVTSYANATGRVNWSRPTGGSAQTWTVSGPYLYMAQSAGGSLSSSPITAVRRIDLRTGATEDVRPAGRAFSGNLAAVVGGVALFSSSGSLAAYNAQTGRLLWRQRSAALELVDTRSQALYVNSGGALSLFSPTQGKAKGRPVSALSSSLYAVHGGVALGLDQNQGALGEAWGYSMVSRKVVWTSAALPWPHFFVDMTGLGGSISADGSVVLLVTCAAEGAVRANNSAVCQRPELAAVSY